MTRQTRRLIIAIAGALLVIAVATTAVAFRGSLAHLPGLTWLQPEAPAEVWVCPMHPDVRSPHPGRCPQCGMALVKEDPKAAGDAHAGAHAGQAQAASPAAPDVSAPPPDTVGDGRAAVTLDGRRQQLMGVRTVPVARRTLAARARATGLVTADETRETEVTLKVEGWIEELHVDYTGRAVKRGEPLFALYSPDLIAAQQEYVLARQAREQAATSQVPESRDIADRLVSAARERLQLWDLPASAIETLEQTGTPSRTIVFPSPVTGVVIAKHAVQGMRVTASSSCSAPPRSRSGRLDDAAVADRRGARHLGRPGDHRRPSGRGAAPTSSRTRSPTRSCRRWCRRRASARCAASPTSGSRTST
jgi:hypothetical protein